MIRMAHGLINGDWLGDYYGVLLMKGCFFPMFLTAAKLVKVPYLQAVTLAHSAACVFFVSQVRSLIRDRRLLVVMAAVLLDCSVTALRVWPVASPPDRST